MGKNQHRWLANCQCGQTAVDVGVTLPNDIPNYPGHSPAFIFRLLLSWAAMGFRRPKVVW